MNPVALLSLDDDTDPDCDADWASDGYEWEHDSDPNDPQETPMLGIRINDGAEYATSGTLSLVFPGLVADRVEVSETDDFSSATSCAPESTILFSLASLAQGLRPLYGRTFRGDPPQEEESVIIGSVILDTEAPVLAVAEPVDQSTTADPAVDVRGAVSDAGGPIRVWVSELRSEADHDRKAALTRLEAIRSEIIAHLTDIVRQPVAFPEPFFDPSTTRNMAIHLLGVYQAESAIPLLIENLAPSPRHIGDADNPLTPVPATEALRRIGPRATSALLESLRTTTNAMVAIECTRLLLDIEPAEKSRAMIRELISSGNVPRAVAIQRQLDNLESHRADGPPSSE